MAISPTARAAIEDPAFLAKEKVLLDSATHYAGNFVQLLAIFKTGAYYDAGRMVAGMGHNLNRMVDYIDEWEVHHAKQGIDAMAYIMGDPESAFGIPLFHQLGLEELQVEYDLQHHIKWSLDAAEEPKRDL